MSAPNVTVNRQNGGIGRQASGSDYYSGLLFYIKSASTLPTGFSTNQIQSLNSINDLIALGITGNSSDETKATATTTFTSAGTAADTATITFVNPKTGVSTVLGSITVQASPTVTTTATSFTTAINALTTTTGWNAANTSGALTLTAPAGFGASLNSGTPLVITFSAGATIAPTSLTQPSSGVGSEQDVIYYHTREAFRVQGILNGKPQGQIWVGVYKEQSSPNTYANFTEVATMQSFVNGQIKQLGVWATGSAFATSHVTALNAQAVALAAQNMPLAIIYQGDLHGVALTALANVRTLNSQFVQCTFGQDGGNVGNNLFLNFNSLRSVGCLGVTLGAWALAGVQQSIISRAVFNVVDILEYTKLAWANGALLSASGAGLSATIDAVDALGYVFLRNESSPVSSALFGGVFFNNDSTCTVITSDYAYMPNVRTMNKAALGVRAAILPALGETIYFDATGKLTVDSINYLQHLGDTVIGGKSGSTTGSMASAGEISDGQTIIDPTQNVQGTNTVAITMKIVQAGVARYIVINIGFAASLTQ